ncbi:MAG: hypothetical protein COA50_08755 [Flavobacteriaceae bacterium]|nr:MAG: hypothetical protein COA50_08755 [Flavobacteriaceae bacterium]
MKNYIIPIVVGIVLNSCAQERKKETLIEVDTETVSNSKEGQMDLSSEDLEMSIEALGKLLKGGDKDQESSTPEEVDLEKLIQIGGASEMGSTGAFENMFSSSAILDLLEQSGVSRAEMEKLIKNPDSLKILAQEAMKNRQAAQNEAPVLKGKITKKQLSSKNTPTGVSLEEAILLVQAESGPEATMAKLKKIDSLAGTDVMKQMDFTEAGYVFNDVATKNEPKASAVENEMMKNLRTRSGQIHSEKEAGELLAELEKAEKDIASGKIEASPQYQKTIEHQRKAVSFYKKDIVRKSNAAKKKFQQLNPDLYFGEEVGETYFGGPHKTAVYLPLGTLSFADKMVKANHPLLMTQQAKNVLGEPDVLETFDDVTGIHSLGLGGSLTIQFIDNALTDVNGPDLYIFEIGQLEPTNLEISKDGKSWIKVGKIDGGVAEVDISPFVKRGELFYYVRLIDLKMDSALPGADVDAIAAIGAAMRLNLDSKVLFETGKSQLKPEGVLALKELANSISILKKGNVIVEGHTDDVGSDVTNQKLSLERAKSVSGVLKKLIPSRSFRWKEKGFGASRPLVENDNDENRAKNRRVEVLVVPN